MLRPLLLKPKGRNAFLMKKGRFVMERKQTALNPVLKQIFFQIAAIFIIFTLTGYAEAQATDLTAFSLEELMDVKVTSVNKKSQRLSESAAAVFVITREDIRRSGATSIPDALRMAPGVNVARIDANKWAVNCRGFNSRFSPSLLVLIDGRSVYTPSFSGVYWEVTDVFLEDVDRIEIIRGPGATIWGANAVNGVINIITRHSNETRGGYVEARMGTVEKNMAGFRYGGAAGADATWRIYGKHQARDEFELDSGGDAGDDWQINQAGFRLDKDFAPASSLTLQGDLYDGRIHQDLYLVSESSPYMDVFPETTRVSGGNIMARWTKTLSGTSEVAFQVYYDAMRRSEDFINEDRHNLDAQFQHRFALGTRNDIIWGARFRLSDDDFAGSIITDMDPESTTDYLYSAFIQDEISFLNDRIKLTLGSKFEHNDYTGFEIQPSTRLMWSASKHHKVWAAVSRAVRIPSRVETDAVVPVYGSEYNGLPVYARFLNNKDQDAEVLLACEAGYRFIPGHKFSLDVAIFFNDYDKLRVYGPGARHYDPVHNILIQDLELSNLSKASSWGAELALDIVSSEKIKWSLAYSLTLHEFNDERDFKIDFGFTKHQASLRGEFKLTRDIGLNAWLRYVGKTRATCSFYSDAIYPIDDYLTLDLRLGWKVKPGLEVFLAGQNLLEDSHLEFVQEAFSRFVDVPRSVYAGVSYKF